MVFDNTNEFADCSNKRKRNTVYNVKPRPNARNILTQHIVTLLGTTCCAPLATCCVLLGQVWKWWNFSRNILNVAWCYTRLATFVQHCCAGARALVRFALSNMLQQGGQTYATCWLMLCQTMLRYVALKCCARLAGSFKSYNMTQQCCDMLRWKVASVWPGL